MDFNIYQRVFMMMKIIVETDMKSYMKSYSWKSVESSEWVITMHSNVDKYIESRHIEVSVTMNMRF